MKHLNTHKIKTKRVGWVNYVDETGMVYYGTRSGLISRLKRRELINFKDALIDSFNFESVTLAQSCADKSAQFIKKIDNLSKHVQLLADLSCSIDKDDHSECVENTLSNFKRKLELCICDDVNCVLNVDELGIYLQFVCADELYAH